MSFTVKGMCQHGELAHRRGTAEAALKKARELSKTGCYDVHIITPQGRDYAASEFADFPRTPSASQSTQKTPQRMRSAPPLSEIDIRRHQKS
jgi:hypothetical protein